MGASLKTYDYFELTECGIVKVDRLPHLAEARSSC